jgi:methionyl-tRNA formyltransferase
MSVEDVPSRIKILRCALTSGSGEPGTVLDDQLTIACADGAIRITELQRAGKAPMKATEFLRGVPVKAGARFF